MGENKDIVLGTNDAIALCHILEDFEKFNIAVQDFANNNGREGVYYLFKISSGRFVLGKGKIKRFYLENKEIIDRINKYSSIGDFIRDNYIGRDNSSLFYVFQYVKEHSNELEKVLMFLERIKVLRISHFTLNPTLDFKGENYQIRKEFNWNSNVVYLDNLKGIPSYDGLIVNYKTTGSNYKITLKPLGIGKEFCSYKEIAVNSLLIDVSKLPRELTKEVIFDKIVGLNEECKVESNNIRNSVNMSVSIGDLVKQFNIVNRNINKLDNTQNKSELLKVLKDLQQDIDKLKILSVQYDESILQDGVITIETLVKEKKLYLERRRLDNIDLD